MELRIANRLKATGQTIRPEGKTRNAASAAGSGEGGGTAGESE